MEFEFKIVENKLITTYTPWYGLDGVIKRIKTEGYNLRNTFFVEKNDLIEMKELDNYGDSICFVIGVLSDNYIKLDKDIFGTKHDFYFTKDFKFQQKMFIANQNISIVRKIDEVIDYDIYIGDENNHEHEIPKDIYKELVKSFPNKTELIKYSHKRIASILKEFLPETDKYEEIYEKYLSKKEHFVEINRMDFNSDINTQIEIEQFKIALDEFKYMLGNMEGYCEKVWQSKIHDILCLLYPKYILYAREMSFKGIEKHDKRPDFVLVDANGFIDVLEIKKPDASIITVHPSYRHNYIPVREMIGSIQQIEKYIYCLNNLSVENDKFFDELKKQLPARVQPRALNPQGILILGRSNNFNSQQLRDFELIKRQYKNIAEIITYDDLLFRIENIIEALENKKH